MELARTLPALVEELRALREDMTRKSELYDSLLRTSSSSSSSSSFDPLRRSTTSDGLNSSSNHDHNHDRLSTPFLHRPTRGTSAPKHPSHPHSSWSSPFSKHLDSYTVIYVSGDCGIALRNYAKRDTKVGAQIAMLHHADGVTTGMSKCRLGDQLMKINNESVTTWPFAEIVETLEIARRPISLTFRTNANVQTSPRASTAPTSSSFAPSSSSPSSSSSSMRFSASLPLRKSKSETEDAAAVARKASTSSFFSRSWSAKEKNKQKTRDGCVMDDKRQSCSQIDRLKDDEDEGDDIISRQRSVSHDTLKSVGGGRGTMTSMQSRSSMLSEDVETWCREQEEMHSDIIMLLTETVMRCERLQQENLDQLQNLMQLSVSSPCSLSDRSSAASSYAGAEKSGNGEDKCLEFLDGDASVAGTSPTSLSPRA